MNRFAIALDLDGTLIAHWDGQYSIESFGAPLPESVAFTKLLHSMGADIIIFTCRGNAAMNKRTPEECHDIIKMFLDQHGYAYDRIYVGQGKPVADWYIDDRAIPCTPETHGTKAYSAVLDFLRRWSTGNKISYTGSAKK